MSIEALLESSERVVKTSVCDAPDGISYDVHYLDRDGLRQGDEVLLEIRTHTERLVLIGGNPVRLEGVSGRGSVFAVDLETGEMQIHDMEPDSVLEIAPTNTLYWYENVGGENEPFVLRDHCDDFNPDHEPSVVTVVNMIEVALKSKW